MWTGLDCLEAGLEGMVLLVECRLLDLVAEGVPVAYVRFQLRQLSRPEGICNDWWVIKLCHTERDVEDDWKIHRLEVCVGWIGSQVQLLPVGQIVKTRETVAHFVESFHELCGVQAAPIEYLLECPSAEVHLMLDPLGWEQRWWCVPSGDRSRI